MATNKPSAKARRSAARLAAVQVLYQMDIAAKTVDEALGEFSAHHVGLELDGERFVEPNVALFEAIVRGVADRRDHLDHLISSNLGGMWTLDRLESALRGILRAGAWELLDHLDVPVPIIISEYVNLTHAFFSGKEPGMVNAVLDHIARVVRDDGTDPVAAP